MFTFQHVTSIGISKEEYDRRIAAEEKNLVKGEAKWYREISTTVTVPTLDSDLATLLADDEDEDHSVVGTHRSEKMRLGQDVVYVSEVVKHYIVGLKLSVNQKVQAANRDGGNGTSNMEIVKSVLMRLKPGSEEFNGAIGALVSAKTVKAFAEKWMRDNPEWTVG